MEHLELLTSSKHQTKSQKDLKTFKVSQSSALDKAKLFMPLLAEANEELDTKIKSEGTSQVDMENIDGHNGSIIEMNLALFETEDDSSEEDSLEVSDTDSDCSCDEMNCSCFKHPPNLGALTSLKLPPSGSVSNKMKGSKPVIEILSSKETVDYSTETDNKDKKTMHLQENAN